MAGWLEMALDVNYIKMLFQKPCNFSHFQNKKKSPAITGLLILKFAVLSLRYSLKRDIIVRDSALSTGHTRAGLALKIIAVGC